MTGNLILDIYDDVDDGGGGNQIVEEFTLDEPSGAENGVLFNWKALLCFLSYASYDISMRVKCRDKLRQNRNFATIFGEGFECE